MTPLEYRRHFDRECGQARAAARTSVVDEHLKYLPLNWQRTVRIERTFTPSSRIQQAVKAIKCPQLWMVLTEPWCGDSAQNLPYIAGIAACSSCIDLRILLRDRNLDIMEAYLTQGTQSIPKLVSFDLRGGELFQWGPRPQPAAELFHRLKEAGTPIEDVRLKLHLWYARNHGRALEEEFLLLLAS